MLRFRDRHVYSPQVPLKNQQKNKVGGNGITLHGLRHQGLSSLRMRDSCRKRMRDCCSGRARPPDKVNVFISDHSEKITALIKELLILNRAQSSTVGESVEEIEKQKCEQKRLRQELVRVLDFRNRGRLRAR